jgi:hypothetical protein
MFAGVTYVGPEADDREVLERVPDDLRRFLEQTNGLVAFDGGLHIRGAAREPLWHSLRHVWTGGLALHERYEAVRADDVPFAQDAVGDQWLLRDGQVVRLAAETGDVELLGQSFGEFLEAVSVAPTDTLGLHPLMQFQAEGGTLAPGQLLSVYPPFCTKQSADGVSLAAVPAAERLEFLADLARHLPADGPFRLGFEQA